MNLNKRMYKPLEAGNYEVTINDWEIVSKPTKQGGVWTYLHVKSVVTETNRPIDTMRFNEVGVDIQCKNILKYYDLDDIDQADILEYVKGKTIPAYLEIKYDPEADKHYYNWNLCK